MNKVIDGNKNQEDIILKLLPIGLHKTFNGFYQFFAKKSKENFCAFILAVYMAGYGDAVKTTKKDRNK